MVQFRPRATKGVAITQGVVTLQMIMKTQILSLALACGGALVLPVSAGSSAKGGMPSAKDVVAIQPAAPECSSRQIQPLFTRYAQTTQKWTLRGTYSQFTDLALQEVDSFDGSLVDFELTVPLTDRLQARFYLPVYTDGDARRTDSGNPVDINGDGGLLDFPSIILDYQFMQAESKGDWNMAAYFGAGGIINYIEETDRVTGAVDRINHRGAAAMFGLKADKQLSDCWQLISNLGGRYYWDSDDIHPNDGSDIFFLLDASVAFVYAPESAWAYPIIEFVYQGSFSAYNSLQVVPQVVVPIGDHVDLNAGVSLGLLDEGPATDARLQMTVRF